MIKTFLLLFVLIALFIYIGRFFAGKKAIAIAFFAALIINLFMDWYSDTAMLKVYSSYPAPENHKFVGIINKISEKAGLTVSKVYIIPYGSTNIFNPEDNTIAATKDIFSMLNDDELTGVTAHEIAHLKYHDTVIQIFAASISGAITLLLLFVFLFGGNSRLGWTKILSIAFLATITVSIITMAISREREYKADEYAARITGKPMSLASALQKLDSGLSRQAIDNRLITSPHMLIGNLFSYAGNREVFSSHPPIEKRVLRLRKLATDLGK